MVDTKTKGNISIQKEPARAHRVSALGLVESYFTLRGHMQVSVRQELPSGSCEGAKWEPTTPSLSKSMHSPWAVKGHECGISRQD